MHIILKYSYCAIDTAETRLLPFQADEIFLKPDKELALRSRISSLPSIGYRGHPLAFGATRTPSTSLSNAKQSSVPSANRATNCRKSAMSDISESEIRVNAAVLSECDRLRQRETFLLRANQETEDKRRETVRQLAVARSAIQALQEAIYSRDESIRLLQA
jgi:hypothetical protein